VSRGRPGQVTAVDAGVSFLGSAYDEHRERAVVRPVDPVACVRRDQSLAAGDRTRVHRDSVHVGLRRGGPRHPAGRRVGAAAAVTIPVNLHQPALSSSSTAEASTDPSLGDLHHVLSDSQLPYALYTDGIIPIDSLPSL